MDGVVILTNLKSGKKHVYSTVSTMIWHGIYKEYGTYYTYELLAKGKGSFKTEDWQIERNPIIRKKK
jgi:hypothetical protein